MNNVCIAGVELHTQAFTAHQNYDICGKGYFLRKSFLMTSNYSL